MPTKIKVLVTRPAHQADNLAKKINRIDAQALLFPTIEIKTSQSCQSSLNINTTIKQYDIALFVSQNAVHHAFEFIHADKLPDTLKIGVIGKGSLDSLNQYGVQSQAMPDQTFNSEGLLNSKLLLDVNNKNIIIFRGQAGRNLLGDTLIERGASVTYCEVYQRCIPNINNEYYKKTFQSRPDVAIFTSSEGLLYAFKMLEPKEAKELLNIPWILISERMKKTAYNLGHNSDIIIAKQASDDGIMSSLQQWLETK